MSEQTGFSRFSVFGFQHLLVCLNVFGGVQLAAYKGWRTKVFEAAEDASAEKKRGFACF
jgi:hypothetical protein